MISDYGSEIENKSKRDANKIVAVCFILFFLFFAVWTLYSVGKILIFSF